MHAYADGRLEMRHEGQRLPCTAFEQQRRVTHGDIVSNKRLGAVLAKIQADQRTRDERFLASTHHTLREKQRIRTARAQADAPPASP